MWDVLGRTGRKFLFWMQRGRLDRELAEELETHIQLKQAHASEEQCYREMGNLTLAKEESRDQWGFVWLERWVQDIRYALRTLRKNPGFALIALLSLSLGIAGNTAIFSIIDALLIKPLPFPEPNRLVRITGLYPKAILDHFQKHARTIEIAYISPGPD